MSNQQALVSLQSVSKSYREGDQLLSIYCNINLTLNRAERLALLGRSGCGKTTLLNLISGIDEVDEGDIIVNGVNVTSLNEVQRSLFRRRHIGFVFQFFNLVPTLTVLENLRLPLELTGVNATQATQRALELLDKIGLSGRGNSFPEVLSGGEQQRVAIARALIHKPPLILADEPTGNLDNETGRMILSLLDELLTETQAALIMVTHSPEAAALAHRKVVIADKQLIEQSP
jgi:putative ABC transport system ATP-binding protein